AGADGVLAGVAGGADARVVAGRGVVGVRAAARRIARVVGAGVGVVAVGRRPAHAGAVLADVAGGARVAVLAGRGVVGVEAAAGPITGVVGARIAVVAEELADAGPTLAGVVHRAGVAVVAGHSGVRVFAAGGGVAGVVGAEVAVVAIGCRAADARAGHAGVPRGAGVAIVAGRGVGDVQADARGAAVVGAGVTVVAERMGHAGARLTGVAGRAGVTVVAGGGVVHVQAAEHRVAAVVGARIAVVAVGGTAA